MIASFPLKVFEVKCLSSYWCVQFKFRTTEVSFNHTFFTLRTLNFLKSMDRRVRESHGHVLHLTLYTQSSPIKPPPRWSSEALTHTYFAVISELSGMTRPAFSIWTERTGQCIALLVRVSSWVRQHLSQTEVLGDSGICGSAIVKDILHRNLPGEMWSF